MKDEIIIYQAHDQSVRIEVKVEDETVWLTQAQMVELFQSTKQNISLHINNVFKEGELDSSSTVKEYLTVQIEGLRKVKRLIQYYNLDVIISVGYRVKSARGTQFRLWANRILKDYILKGYAVNQRIDNVEYKVLKIEQRLDNFDMQLNTQLLPKEGLFFQDQIFDSYVFVNKLIEKANKSIILIDNYIDESVLLMLTKRKPIVKAKIYTNHLNAKTQLDIQKHNSQYPPIDIKTFSKAHDRFLIIDQKEVFHIGASLKDLGKKLFAFSRLEINPTVILDLVEGEK
ncbi:MAG: virulence RhuM family protein [Bacteroidales bacterium]|nr:virulence RhuM family protein [Bacteroidales bacterium]